MGVADGSCVAFRTGLRLWVLLMATKSAVMSIRMLVVVSSVTSKWMITSILSDGTFKFSVVASL